VRIQEEKVARNLWILIILRKIRSQVDFEVMMRPAVQKAFEGCAGIASKFRQSYLVFVKVLVERVAVARNLRRIFRWFLEESDVELILRSW
jgi:hypothetical protein